MFVRIKSHKEVQNNFVAAVHLRECSCAPILRVFSATSDGATAERSIQNRVFGQFCSILRKAGIANYGSIWMEFSTSVRRTEVLCNA